MTEHPLPQRVVSAAGFASILGGGSLAPAARSALAGAAEASWLTAELQEWAGEVIADLTGAESGCVTAGAAAGLTLAAAACIAGEDAARIASLPVPAEAAEIVIQRGHRQSYDRALRTAGATIVDVGYPYAEGIGRTYAWEVDAAFSERTVAVAYCARAERTGLPLREVCELAHSRGLPVIVDAAAELPPAGNLRRFIADGADVVVFSGGKAVRGPQASGIVAGRRDLVAAMRLQMLDLDVDPTQWIARHGQAPPHHGLGRSLKVGKEAIIALVAALRAFAVTDHEEQRRALERWLIEMRAALGAGTVEPGSASAFYPRLILEFANESEARTVAATLATCSPRIIVPHAPLERCEIVICPEAIDEADRDHVVAASLDAIRRCRSSD
jgi:D-glucosaminate-6-phosphate ammonia-lyase